MKNALYPSRIRAWFTVSILMLAYVLSFVDRQILNLLVGPIRHDMDISDTQMSLLMGSRLRFSTPSVASRWGGLPTARAGVTC